jgi:hypothetical protein
MVSADGGPDPVPETGRTVPVRPRRAGEPPRKTDPTPLEPKADRLAAEECLRLYVSLWRPGAQRGGKARPRPRWTPNEALAGALQRWRAALADAAIVTGAAPGAEGTVNVGRMVEASALAAVDPMLTLELARQWTWETVPIPDYVRQAAGVWAGTPRGGFTVATSAERFLRALTLYGGERPDAERGPHAATPLLEVFPPEELPNVLGPLLPIQAGPLLLPADTEEAAFARWVLDEALRLLVEVRDGRADAPTAMLALIRAWAKEYGARWLAERERPPYVYVRLDGRTDWRLVREAERRAAARGWCPEPLASKEPRPGRPSKENASAERLWEAWPYFVRHVLRGEPQQAGDRTAGRMWAEIAAVLDRGGEA